MLAIQPFSLKNAALDRADDAPLSALTFTVIGQLVEEDPPAIDFSDPDGKD
jgi:hypothetical protein